MGDWRSFLGMVSVMFSYVGLMIVSKAAIDNGMSIYILNLYAAALSAIILFPISSFFHSSPSLPLTFSILCRFFLLGVIGFVCHITRYVGIEYSSPNLGMAMLNLLPACTFILAVIFRMEKLDWRAASTQAKSAGTVVSIAGAFIVTFYKGPALIKATQHLSLSGSTQISWILGGVSFAAESLAMSLFYIVQAAIVKKYPRLLTVLSYYFLFLTLLSLATCLVIERDPSAWILRPDIGLVAVVFVAIIGTIFRVGMTAWCLKRTGPLYVSLFKPAGIVISVAMEVLFLGDSFYLGSLVGAVIIVSGFSGVMWGKAREAEMEKELIAGGLESGTKRTPLLQDMVQGHTSTT
uniref:WAT1-related protein n=1 Tax=Kalanchoe fedtschenkoi TaxID=63787 RepID=A0A7N0T845_KALFE